MSAFERTLSSISYRIVLDAQGAGDTGELKSCVDLLQSAVSALLAHLDDRRAILAEYFARWKAYTDTGREFRTHWHQFVSDARQVTGVPAQGRI